MCLIFCVNSKVPIFWVRFACAAKEKSALALVQGEIGVAKLPQVRVVAPKCWSDVEKKSCFMFMFRKRRSSLTRRLEKARKRRGDETRRSSEDEAKSLLKKLNYDQLEILCTAVESRGRDASNCVLLPPENQPHVLCCQTWRWPEVHESGQLKRLPTCSSVTDPVYICCNPYHWSRICLPGEIARKTVNT